MANTNKEYLYQNSEEALNEAMFLRGIAGLNAAIHSRNEPTAIDYDQAEDALLVALLNKSSKFAKIYTAAGKPPASEVKMAEFT